MSRKAPVVDLARERRLRALDARMGALLSTGGPELAERTRAMLAGDLDAPGLEEDDRMAANDSAMQLRLPTEALARADALVDPLARDPMLRAIGRGVKRATVLRLAVLRGLDALEAEYGARKGRGGRK